MLATRSPCALSAGLVVSAAVWKVVALQTAHLFTAVSHRYTHTVCHTHTLTHTHVMCEASLKAPLSLSCVCQSARPVPESAFRSVCAAERRQRGPAPAPAGPASRCVCSSAQLDLCDCLLPESPDVPDEMFCVVSARRVRKCNISH